MPDLPESVQLGSGTGGLPVLRIDGAGATAEIYLHGATVTGWTPRGSGPVLFVSAASRFATDAAIRGGVPICFPWFGARAGHPEAPRHGFARLSDWSLVWAQDDGKDVTVRLRLTGNDVTGVADWPCPFEADYTVVVGSRLSLALRVTNPGDDVLVFEEALHTYLDVRDIRSTEVTGLERIPFYDSLAGPEQMPGEPGPVRFDSATDRIYVGTGSGMAVRDVEAGQSVLIGKEGSRATVVWNPWVDTARALIDLGDDEWQRMVCVEVCNVRDAAVRLDPGASHTMVATFEVAQSSAPSTKTLTRDSDLDLDRKEPAR